jgi:hypothetical protein
MVEALVVAPYPLLFFVPAGFGDGAVLTYLVLSIGLLVLDGEDMMASPAGIVESDGAERWVVR